MTDNSAALRDAINAGHAVLIPEGTFNFNETLTLKKDSIIVGVGKKSILLPLVDMQFSHALRPGCNRPRPNSPQEFLKVAR